MIFTNIIYQEIHCTNNNANNDNFCPLEYTNSYFNQQTLLKILTLKEQILKSKFKICLLLDEEKNDDTEVQKTQTKNFSLPMQINPNADKILYDVHKVAYKNILVGNDLDSYYNFLMFIDINNGSFPSKDIDNYEKKISNGLLKHSINSLACKKINKKKRNFSYHEDNDSWMRKSFYNEFNNILWPHFLYYYNKTLSEQFHPCQRRYNRFYDFIYQKLLEEPHYIININELNRIFDENSKNILNFDELSNIYQNKIDISVKYNLSLQELNLFHHMKIELNFDHLIKDEENLNYSVIKDNIKSFLALYIIYDFKPANYQEIYILNDILYDKISSIILRNLTNMIDTEKQFFDNIIEESDLCFMNIFIFYYLIPVFTERFISQTHRQKNYRIKTTDLREYYHLLSIIKSHDFCFFNPTSESKSFTELLKENIMNRIDFLYNNYPDYIFYLERIRYNISENLDDKIKIIININSVLLSFHYKKIIYFSIFEIMRNKRDSIMFGFIDKIFKSNLSLMKLKLNIIKDICIELKNHK